MADQPLLQDACDKVRVEVSLRCDNKNLQVRAWFSSKEDRGHKQILERDSYLPVEMDVSQQAVLDYLVLTLDVKEDRRFVCQFTLSRKDLEGSATSTTIIVGNRDVHLQVRDFKSSCNSRRFAKHQAVSQEDLEDRDHFLEELNRLAETRAEWKGIGIFYKFFGPSYAITKAACDATSQKMWMKGHVDNLVAGPGIVYALRMIVAMFAFYCVVLWLFGYLLLPGCLQGTVGRTGVCLFPMSFYLVYVVGAYCKLYFEAAVMGCILPPKIKIGGEPSFFGFGWVFASSTMSTKVVIWLVIKMIGSAATSLDIFSGSIFLARVRATHALTKDFTWTMEDAWVRSLEASSFFSRFAHLGYPTFLFAVWLTWLSVLLQLLFAMAYSLPLSGELQSSRRAPQKVWYDFRPLEDDDKRYFRKRFLDCACISGDTEFGESPEECKDFVDYAEYSTLAVRHQVHGRALVALLKGGRMSMALSNDTEYVSVVVQNWKPKEIVNYQWQLGGFFLVFMIQRLLTISMQASFVGITKNLTQDTAGLHIDWISAMNVLLGCGMGLSTIFGEVRLSWMLTRRIFSYADGAASKQEKWQVKTDKTWSIISFSYTLMFALFSILWLVYCVMKVVWVNECPCGLWNFHLSWESLGYCVTFDDTLECRMDSSWLNKTRPMHIDPITLGYSRVTVPASVCSALGFQGLHG